MEQLIELVGFLRDTKKEVRYVAAQNLAQYVPSLEAQEILITSEKLIPNLKLLLADVDYVAKQAFICLLQLSTNVAFCKKMIAEKLIPLLMETASDKDNLFVEVALIILSNITRLDEGRNAFLQLGTDYEGMYAFKLIQKFCVPLPPSATVKEDRYQWVGAILTNISQLDAGRNILLEDSGSMLLLVTGANISPSPVRNRGISSTIKNCLFNSVHHLDLLKAGILDAIVPPFISCSQEYSEEELAKLPSTAQEKFKTEGSQMVPDYEVIEPLLEGIILLCSSLETRNFLRDASLYPVMREYDKVLVDPEAKDLVLRVVNFLIRDE